MRAHTFSFSSMDELSLAFYLLYLKIEFETKLSLFRFTCVSSESLRLFVEFVLSRFPCERFVTQFGMVLQKNSNFCGAFLSHRWKQIGNLATFDERNSLVCFERIAFYRRSSNRIATLAHTHTHIHTSAMSKYIFRRHGEVDINSSEFKFLA